jgi:hypothetical protein
MFCPRRLDENLKAELDSVLSKIAPNKISVNNEEQTDFVTRNG